MATDFDLLDTELPPAVICEVGFRRTDGEIIPESQIGGGGSGLPDDQEWSELSRVTTTIILPEDQCEDFSIVLERIDSITFGMGIKTLKLNLTGW